MNNKSLSQLIKDRIDFAKKMAKEADKEDSWVVMVAYEEVVGELTAIQSTLNEVIEEIEKSKANSSEELENEELDEWELDEPIAYEKGKMDGLSEVLKLLK